MNSNSYKDNIKKVYDIALENYLNLRQIYAENLEFFIKYSVKIRVTHRFISYTKL